MMSRQEKTPEKFPPLGHPLESPPEEETQNILHILPMDVIAVVAAKLDLKSLGMLMQVCRTTRDHLNEQPYVWKSMLWHLGKSPEKNKTGVECKKETRKIIFFRSIQQFYSKDLKLKEDISLEETIELHQAFITARDALSNFFEAPETACIAFFKFQLALSRIADDCRRFDRYCGLLENLRNKHGTVTVLPESVQAMKNLTSYFKCMLNGYHSVITTVTQIAGEFSRQFLQFYSIFSDDEVSGKLSSSELSQLTNNADFKRVISNVLEQCERMLLPVKHDQQKDQEDVSVTVNPNTLN